jgi:hypothetical protein
MPITIVAYGTPNAKWNANDVVGGVSEVAFGLDGSVNVRSKIIFQSFIKGKYL